jgi:nucleoside-diphosphate-sugar epimerase
VTHPSTDHLRGKKVLVTGGCGFIGMNLTTELLRSGATVSVLDMPDADWERLPQEVVRIRADLLDPSTLTGVLEGVDIVYHLAARTDLDGTSLPDYRVNFEGTANLLAEVSGSSMPQRFVFYSTMLTVGVPDDTRFRDERTPYAADTLYGQSKVEGERVVIDTCRRLGLAYTIIRPTSVYGPWGGAPYDAFFRTIKARRYFHVGKADNLVSWVYVKNLVDLTLTASVAQRAENEIYFGSDLHPYTMREIVDTVAGHYGVRIRTLPTLALIAAAYGFGLLRLLGLSVPIYPARLRNMRANYCFSMQKAVELGHVQRQDLAGGIAETLDWYDARDRAVSGSVARATGGEAAA